MRRFELMGIVNVTPDSFSDGGLFAAPDAALLHARRLVEEGADIVDIGGESTRPGAAAVDAELELHRVLPVVQGAVALGRTVSVDTSKLAVAQAALQAGATYINDVTAFRADPELAGLVASSGARCCLMHMQGEPRTMQDAPRYEDVVDEVKAFLEQRLEFAVREGVKEHRIDIDPGIGFGKTLEHNLELLRRVDELVALGRPVLIGTSRKSFLGRLSGRPQADRLPGTIASCVLAFAGGASIFRVHDVAPVADALAVAAATLA